MDKQQTSESSKKRGRPSNSATLVKNEKEMELPNWNELLGTKELGQIDSDVSGKDEILFKKLGKSDSTVESEESEEERELRKQELDYALLNLFKYKIGPYINEYKESTGLVCSSVDSIDQRHYQAFSNIGRNNQRNKALKEEFIRQSTSHNNDAIDSISGDSRIDPIGVSVHSKQSL
jgi:hypothetical protein